MRYRCILKGTFVLLAFLFPAVALAAPSVSFLPENPIGGSAVFVKKNCLYCHAIQGYGGSEGPDLGRLELKGGFLGMAGFMWNHAPKMIEMLARDKVPFPKFDTEEMTQLVAFLYSLNYLDPPGDARRGEEVFTSKRCVHCHKVGGKGGLGASSLDKYGNFVSPIFVATALWNKGPKMAAMMKQENIERPILSGGDVRDIVAFIRNRANRPSDSPSRIFLKPGNPRRGASLFESKRCSECHSLQEERMGDGPRLVAGLKVNLSGIASQLWNHSPGMWALWKEKGVSPISLTVEEMSDITAFLYFLQFTTPPGDPERGVHLYINSGCVKCHTPSAMDKGPVGPDLRKKGPWASDIDLAREMWNHAGNMYGTLPVASLEWPRLTEREVADLLAYVRAIGGSLKKEKKEK